MERTNNQCYNEEVNMAMIYGESPMSEKTYNYLGNDITDIHIQLEHPGYGYVDEDNIPHIKWGQETDKCDSNGFDKTYRPLDSEDAYLIRDYVLPRGTIICRYGFPGGIFSTLKGTAYEDLSLPYVKETIEYHEYKVSEDLMVKCYVSKGIVAPMFSSKGGAVQFMHKQSIMLECEDGFIQEDMTWRQKNT